MTSREKAKQLLDKYDRRGDLPCGMEDSIAQALDAARKEGLETAAQIVDHKAVKTGRGILDEAAAEIRALKEEQSR